MSLPARSDYAAEVRRKSERLRRTRRRQADLFRDLFRLGAIGWMFVLPLLVGVALGYLVARMSGFFAATIIGLLLGLAAGAFGTVLQVRRILTDEGDAADRPSDPGGEV